MVLVTAQTPGFGHGTTHDGHPLHPFQRFFFAFFSSFRFLVNLPLLDRPLTLGFVWGVTTGDWTVGLGVSLFFELLWLDLFPAGTIIPPNSQASTLASLAVLHHFSITAPAQAVVVMLASLPLAWIFAQVERYHRQYENHAFDRLLKWVKSFGHVSGPAMLTRRSIMIMLAINILAFAMGLTGLLVLVQLTMPRLAPLLWDIPMKWPYLWVVASIGAVLSLRHRPAYAVLLSGVLLAVLSRVMV